MLGRLWVLVLILLGRPDLWGPDLTMATCWSVVAQGFSILDLDNMADSDDEGQDACEWMLGFVVPADRPTDLLRHRFPSKVGGRPAWLRPQDLPSSEQLQCSVSGRRLQFLLQVYAPPPDDGVSGCGHNPDAFHRTLYLFVSPQGNRLSERGAVKALRCQLPKKNDFYPDTPPTGSEKNPPLAPPALLGRDPWKVLEAELDLSSSTPPGIKAADRVGGLPLLPELELVVEAEADVREEEDEKLESHVKSLLGRYEEEVAREGEVTEEELPEEVMDQVEEGMTGEKRHYVAFQSRLAVAPDQCLRYCFSPDAIPLCPSPDDIPPLANLTDKEDPDGRGKVPPCGKCGGPRVFEFQVMPQLLNFLDIDLEDPEALDWGTICVYSCQRSCSFPVSSDGSAYAEEFVWVAGSN